MIKRRGKDQERKRREGKGERKERKGSKPSVSPNVVRFQNHTEGSIKITELDER
jgi:hypothetical protein